MPVHNTQTAPAHAPPRYRHGTTAGIPMHDGRGRVLVEFKVDGQLVHEDQTTGKRYIPYTDIEIEIWELVSQNYTLKGRYGRLPGGIDGMQNRITTKRSFGGRSEGLSINVVAGGGFNLELGRVYDSSGNADWYFAIGPSVGLDASIGYINKAYQRTDGDTFDRNNIKGWGAEHEASFLIADFIFSGGNFDPRKGYNQSYQSEFKNFGAGVSLGSPAAYSMPFSYTWI